MYILSVGTFIERLFRNIFFLIDDAIFSQIPKLYNLLTAIARTSPLSQANIADMASRIYKLLAVFMIFKVTLSLIMYVVNPDDFSDKSKGVSKLITNIVISLALLVLTPYIFSYAYQFQKIILEDNSLATVIFGKETDATNSNLMDAGDQIAYLTISPFVTPNTNTFQGCTNLYNQSKTGEIVLTKECFGFEDANKFGENFETCGDVTSEKLLCGEAWKPDKSDFTRSDLTNYAAGIQYSNYNLFFRKAVVTSRLYVNGKPDYFAFNYSFIISTVVGVLVVLFLITTCMDIALRSIKLAFLQLIAPIPILSYIDPKSGKDGMFKKWYQMCFKTFLSLFIKLLAIYFAIYIISRVGRMVDIIDGSYVTNGLIKIFIIIGALMFAKNFTKILESLGVKLDSGFQLNPFKKLEDEALGMKKPAALANKVAKGVLKSPISGLQTLGKKTIGGIDAARNGKGFKQGWNRTHGALYNKFYKKLDEWAPDSAEARKQERQGREEVKYMNTKWNKGKKNADKLSQYIRDRRAAGDTTFDYNSYKTPYEALNGKDVGAYQSVYKNQEFIQSRMAFDRKDEARKALERVNEATLRGQSLQDALKSQQKFLRANLDESTYNKLFDENGDAKWTNANLTEFSKLRDDTTKSVSGMKEVHESIRKQYQEDAAVEDAIKFVKYNKIDPSEPTKPAADFPELANSTTSTTTSSSTSSSASTTSTSTTTSSSSTSNSSSIPTADEDWSKYHSSFDDVNDFDARNTQAAGMTEAQQQIKNQMDDIERRLNDASLDEATKTALQEQYKELYDRLIASISQGE